MIALAGNGGSITYLMEEPGNQSLLKLWRQQVTRITVINRFSRKYRAKSLQCGIALKVKDLLEKSYTSEGSKTRNLSKGALFSPNAPVQDAPKQKFKLGTSKNTNGEGFSFKMGDVFKDHRALSTIQIVLTLLTFKILEEADLLAFGLIIVTVIALDSRQEGTTATYNPVGRTVILKGLLLLHFLSTSEKSSVNAQGNGEDGKLESPIERVDLPYSVLLAAWTFVAGIFMIAVINGRINRRPLDPTTAAPVPAVPVPAVPVPAVPAPAVPAPAVPAPAIPAPAVPAPAVPAPAVPIGAATPPVDFLMSWML